MAQATDPALRALARRIAARVFIRLARHGRTTSPGVRRLVVARLGANLEANLP